MNKPLLSFIALVLWILVFVVYTAFFFVMGGIDGVVKGILAIVVFPIAIILLFTFAMPVIPTIIGVLFTYSLIKNPKK